MIRLAEQRDVKLIADVHVRSWQAVYRGHMPDDYLDNLSVVRRAEYWANSLRRDPGGIAVADAQAGIVGFVALDALLDDDAEQDTGEIIAIYLDPANWRHGLGRALMMWSSETARARHWTKMTLWVLRENIQARSFYEALRWKANGKIRTETFGGAELTEIRYVSLPDA